VLYLFVLIGLVAMVAAFWAATGPRHKPAIRPRAQAPDDDVEFLRRLGERHRPPTSED